MRTVALAPRPDPRDTRVMASAHLQPAARDSGRRVDVTAASPPVTLPSPAHRRRVRHHEIGVVQRELRRLRRELGRADNRAAG